MNECFRGYIRVCGVLVEHGVSSSEVRLNWPLTEASRLPIGDGLDEATCAVMETSMLEEEGYFNPPTSSGAGVSETAGKKQLESLCRVCANTSDYFIPIFEGEGVEHQLDMKIQKHLPIQVLETDGLPAQVCYQCASTLIAWHDLVTACVEADKKLHQLLQEEEDEEYEDREEKVIEFFNEPPVDSDGGDEFNEPSTSAAVVKVKQSSPPQKRRTTGKGKQQQRKAQVENASSVSDAKNNTVPVVSKEACASLKGVVESASSTERLQEANSSNDVIFSLGSCSRLVSEKNLENFMPCSNMNFIATAVRAGNVFVHDTGVTHMAHSEAVHAECCPNVERKYPFSDNAEFLPVEINVVAQGETGDEDKSVDTKNIEIVVHKDDARSKSSESDISIFSGKTLREEKESICEGNSRIGATFFNDHIYTSEDLIMSNEVCISSNSRVDNDMSIENDILSLEHQVICTRDEVSTSPTVSLKIGCEIYNKNQSVLIEDHNSTSSEVNISNEIVDATERILDYESRNVKNKNLMAYDNNKINITSGSGIDDASDVGVKMDRFLCETVLVRKVGTGVQNISAKPGPGIDNDSRETSNGTVVFIEGDQNCVFNIMNVGNEVVVESEISMDCEHENVKSDVNLFHSICTNCNEDVTQELSILRKNSARILEAKNNYSYGGIRSESDVIGNDHFIPVEIVSSQDCENKSINTHIGRDILVASDNRMENLFNRDMRTDLSIDSSTTLATEGESINHNFLSDLVVGKMQHLCDKRLKRDDSAISNVDEKWTQLESMYGLFADLDNDMDCGNQLFESRKVVSAEEDSRCVSDEAFFIHEMLGECDKIAVCDNSISIPETCFSVQEGLSASVEKNSVDSGLENVCTMTMENVPATSSEQLKQDVEKLFSCELCSKAFRFNEVLQAHVLRVHKQKKSAGKKFSCCACSAEFRSSSLLKEHCISCGAESEVVFKCNYCSKMLKGKNYISKHIQRHLDQQS